MKKLIRLASLAVYYTIGVRFATQPMPGYRIGYALRRWLMKAIAEECGEGVIIKQNAYIGKGEGLRLGDHAQLGTNCRIDQQVTIGAWTLMGPDAVIMTSHHAFQDPDVPIQLQGGEPVRPVVVGRDVWVGTRVIILPGVTVGDRAVLGASAVVTKSVPPGAIVAGSPAKIVGWRVPPEAEPGSSGGTVTSLDDGQPAARR